MTRKKRTQVVDIQKRKSNTPIVCLTAYSAPIAKILDQHVDLLLVGDTVGMVLYGMDSTLTVTVDMMINHGKAVVSHSNQACVVVDMPFGSYQPSKVHACQNASKILAQTGCQAVKLEGGKEMAETISHLVNSGIPVMGHIGLKPQHVQAVGGYKFQGKTAKAKQQIMDDALAVQQAGAFAVVIECVVESIASEITSSLTIPTIGIGASPKCDGQILVTEDMTGLFTDFTPKFVKQYGNLAENIAKAASKYSSEVQARKFPSKEHCS